MDVNQELQALSKKGLQKVNKKPNGGYSRLKLKYRAQQVKLDTAIINLAAARDQEEHYKRLYKEERSEKNSILSRETRMKKDMSDKLDTAAKWERDLNTAFRNKVISYNQLSDKLANEKIEKNFWKGSTIFSTILLVLSIIYGILS